ncbi:hypothetical protein PXD04_11390 (plasmid) [Methanosphaera sp. ISO3-F5]|nr:hypothetical protein [Methanosphaera sp. ISO3-F5]WQH65345.1 hypothetical protein PXD04_11390 [Methanosphaera sp. ISO3-F5]
MKKPCKVIIIINSTIITTYIRNLQPKKRNNIKISTIRRQINKPKTIQWDEKIKPEIKSKEVQY